MKQTRQPALLVLLITAIVVIGWSGTTLDPSGEPTKDDVALAGDIAVTPTPAKTEGALRDLTGPQSTLPTPTQASTIPPAGTPTPEPPPADEPVQTPRPPVPENALAQSYIIERGESGRREVALTFDAGEGTGAVGEMLDFLQEHDIKVSFGITGDMLFNHSDTHLSWTGVSTTGEPIPDDVRISELEGAEQAVLEITGYEMKPFFRPPYGDYDLPSLDLLKEQGYEYTIWWTCDSLGWMGATAAEVIERCGPDGEYGGPGGIILMHVSEEEDYLAMEQLVEAYRAEGYEFVTMEEMIQP
jgi:peptidoglycan/xylan/chitin deacetylase (PgdA/CDA1 family)